MVGTGEREVEADGRQTAWEEREVWKSRVERRGEEGGEVEEERRPLPELVDAAASFW